MGLGYIAGSGYENNGLRFDGVNDTITSNSNISLVNDSITIDIGN